MQHFKYLISFVANTKLDWNDLFMSIRDYYKGECTEKTYIAITAYNLEGVDEQMKNIFKKYKKVKNKYVEILIKLSL